MRSEMLANAEIKREEARKLAAEAEQGLKSLKTNQIAFKSELEALQKLKSRA